MTPDVLTVGETMVALRSTSMLRLGGTLTMSIAGAESNVAIGLARLGHHARWVSRVGDDELGGLIVRTLRAEGVDVDHVVSEPDAVTGLILFDVGPGGGRRAHYRRSTSAARHLTPDDLSVPLRDGARILHVSGITPALGELPSRTIEQAMRAIRATGGTVSFDVNYRAKLWTAAEAERTLRPLLRHVDILIASDDELTLVAAGVDPESRVKGLLSSGIREVVIKRGEHGATVHTTDTTAEAPALPVRVVDPVGAGDAFVAGYLSGLLDDLAISQRLNRATTLGAAAAASSGDWEGLPSRADLDRISVDPGDVLR